MAEEFGIAYIILLLLAVTLLAMCYKPILSRLAKRIVERENKLTEP